MLYRGTLKTIFICLQSITSFTQSWQPLGPNDNNWPSFSRGDYSDIAVNASGDIYMVYKDIQYSQRATVRKYSGSAWSYVGTPGFSSNYAEYTSIAMDNAGV